MRVDARCGPSAVEEAGEKTIPVLLRQKLEQGVGRLRVELKELFGPGQDDEPEVLLRGAALQSREGSSLASQPRSRGLDTFAAGFDTFVTLPECTPHHFALRPVPTSPPAPPRLGPASVGDRTLKYVSLRKKLMGIVLYTVASDLA